MNILFENTTVPIWKIKSGTVVAWEVLGHLCYGHINSFVLNKAGSMVLLVNYGGKILQFDSIKILWLEPHF